MLTWLLASRGTNRLAALYFAVAGVALLVAASTWVLVTAQHNAAASNTLQLNITRYRG